MSDLDIKEFRKKHNLTQQALAGILNVETGTVASWEAGRRNISKKHIKLIELYDIEGLPAPANNNTGSGVSNKDLQINELMQIIKDKDQQINDLTTKFLEALTIIKDKEPINNNSDYIEPLKLKIKDIIKELFRALTIKIHIQKDKRIKTLLEELIKVVD